MNLYLVDALGSRTDAEGIRPDLPEGGPWTWAGVYDEASGKFVVRTDEAFGGLHQLSVGDDVGFDYSGLIPQEPEGSPQPEETGALVQPSEAGAVVLDVPGEYPQGNSVADRVADAETKPAKRAAKKAGAKRR